jgi:hypothetical protein
MVCRASRQGVIICTVPLAVIRAFQPGRVGGSISPGFPMRFSMFRKIIQALLLSLLFVNPLDKKIPRQCKRKKEFEAIAG